MRRLAAQAGVNAEDLIDEFSERAAIIEYLGEQSRDVANARAFELVRDRVTPKEAA